ncbi:hypothetical protein [Streptomyces griseoloalbus]|uniref:Uncharacterized protein n=1 Tax=Streptomyces griseoloalbus TaxID=67303 RepID=A0A7W8BRZ9_9ACTN|nr:hypothetical protein [Streptomyces albaduncus]MBB5128481.1 hypothetical protein [Streptomyces albaduncus]GGW68219.1 hypothetical protein GCM10010340_52930 [Streptomyces albaduncus]
MISPQLTNDGRMVRLPLTDHAAPLLDELALAYAQDPGAVGMLLLAHAAAVVCRDRAAVSEDATDYGRAMTAAEADGTREALLDECPAAATLDPLLSPDEAVTLGTRLTRQAAHIRNNRSKEPRK